jgi:Tfp pilus tip-associated adhesin PilY1
VATAATLDASVLKIGPALDERRVFYAQAPSGSTLPRSLRLLVPPGGDPGTDPDWLDLFSGLGVTGATAADKKTAAESIIGQTLAIKNSSIGSDAVSYVLGDIFHSDPVLVDRPNDFFFYAANLRNENGCGYKCFSDKQRYRRKLLVVGSNDGQLHFFDAGIWDPGPTNPHFTAGTGRELFSFIPRLVLPAVRELAEGDRHVFGVDSTPRADDVFIDPIHNGVPDPTERKWRTVLIGGLREGGSPMGSSSRITDFVSGYYALDITQPDKMNSKGEPISNGTLPDCLSQTNQVVGGCGDLPFPALLWEFTDSTAGSRWDEDLNGFADLGETWSVPTVGRVKVIENGQVREKFVAIFGGGMDAEHKTNMKKGNWLYMVDVETGIPIYKRPLVGSMVADPAAIDVDVDGYLDLLYVGTTAGFIYKVDISDPAPLETVTLPKTSAIPNLAANVTTTRIVDTDTAVVSNSTWDPVPIFDTIGRPIFYAPVAFYVTSQNRFALAFGTGNRENLWDFAGQDGRFYMIIDDNFGPTELSSGIIPLDENDYQKVTPDGSPTPGADFVLAPAAGKQRGWFMALEDDERVITQAFGLAGVVIFSSYQPAITQNGPVCARGGNSRIFVVYANNANPLMTVDGDKSRYRNVPEFVTNPYVEQGATKNPNNQRPGDRNSEQLSAEQLEIMETLKKFFPPCAKFGNYWISVGGIRSDTGYERYATIPIGICQRNWKEH